MHAGFLPPESPHQAAAAAAGMLRDEISVRNIWDNLPVALYLQVRGR